MNRKDTESSSNYIMSSSVQLPSIHIGSPAHELQPAQQSSKNNKKTSFYVPSTTMSHQVDRYRNRFSVPTSSLTELNDKMSYSVERSDLPEIYENGGNNFFKESSQNQSFLNSRFERGGARFSLNEYVNHSPAKIFIRGAKSTVSTLSSRTHNLSILSGKNLDDYTITSTRASLQLPLTNKYRAHTRNDNNFDISNEAEVNYIQKLNESDEIELEDRKRQDLVGDKAINNYFGHYKHLSKIQQQNNQFSVQPSLQTEILAEVERNNLIPSKLGLIKLRGDEDILQLNHMHFGDSYAKILSLGLKRQTGIKKYRLQFNRISENSSAQLLQTISMHASEVNLASNCIGKLGCENLSASLSEYKYNKLGDYAVLALLSGIESNKSLKVLNLSKNFITDRVCPSLQTILDSNGLKELYLHWNLIRGSGGAQIFAGLKGNDQLQVLDLSYNTLGKSAGKSSCVPGVCEFIKFNTELVHFDLSNNNFTYIDSIAISAALVDNKTIYGFHFAGNAGYVDSRGFLIVETGNSDDLTAMHTKLRIKSLEVVDTTIFRTSRDKDLRDCCWICEGWSEKQFKWTTGVSGELRDPLFIHFNFEDYKGNYFGTKNGVQVQDSETDKTFTYSRVIPPGELEYFFSSDEGSEIAKDMKKKFNFDGSSIPNVEIYPGNTTDVLLRETNYMNIHSKKDNFNHYSPNFTVQPRCKDEVYVPMKVKKQRVKWTFPISLFAKWKPDDEETLRKCFEFDWDYGKLPRLIKREEELLQVKEFFRDRYKVLKDAYKNYATKSPVGDVWAIANPAFLEFIEKIKIVDKNLIKDPDINLKWVATISSIPQADKTNPRNPVQAISRYQMMEVLVRIAEEKYILKLKSTTNYFEALKSLWDDHLTQELNSQYDQQIWRSQLYWIENCDIVLKQYKRIVEHVYKRFSKLKVKPGQAPFMCLEEIQIICTKAGLLEEAHFGPNVALQAFNFSMMTQIDEMQSDRTFQMSMLEFYEALARIADAAALELYKPPSSPVNSEEISMTIEQRKNQPLAVKLEALLARMLSTLCEPLFRDKYPPIINSVLTKSYDDEYEN